jgi:hypothetical protein
MASGLGDPETVVSDVGVGVRWRPFVGAINSIWSVTFGGGSFGRKEGVGATSGVGRTLSAIAGLGEGEGEVTEEDMNGGDATAIWGSTD